MDKVALQGRVGVRIDRAEQHILGDNLQMIVLPAVNNFILKDFPDH